MFCSTIIPTVNRPSLERAVKSALHQDLGQDEHEIIIVNDSGQILPQCDWLNSPQIIVVNTNRCDRCFARNVGASMARGKYLHFLDDDDYMLPGGIKALIKKAETSNCAWIYGGHNRVDDEDKFISINQPTVKGNLFGLLVAGETIHMGPSLIRRDAFFVARGFDPEFITGQDRGLECQIALNYDFDCIEQIVASIRVGPGGRTTTNWGTSIQNNRLIREKALNATNALARIMDSIQGDIYLRGRLCRAYLFSAAINLQHGRVFTSCSRLIALLRLTIIYLVWPAYWKGLLLRPSWHTDNIHHDEKQAAIGMSTK